MAISHSVAKSDHVDAKETTRRWTGRLADLRGQAADICSSSAEVCVIHSEQTICSNGSGSVRIYSQGAEGGVLTQRPEVMDAVQRMRRQARSYGYLLSSRYVNVVDSGGYIEVLPLNPSVFYVPIYDPVIVFARPRPGFVVGTPIRFGPAVTISATFGTWGWWTGPAFFWPAHTIVIGGHPWERGWVNRGVYVHPYPHPWVRSVGPRVEIHQHR